MRLHFMRKNVCYIDRDSTFSSSNYPPCYPFLSSAISFVALGTSLPDTFASRTAAIKERYADMAIGNITGSNSVNVFLGLGLPWLIASIYHAVASEVGELNARWGNRQRGRGSDGEVGGIARGVVWGKRQKDRLRVHSTNRLRGR